MKIRKPMQLFYREKGNPEHPTLIILHGLWGASDNWLPVAGLLSEQFHVILPDLRNHGLSPHSSEHNYESISNDIANLIQHLQRSQKPYIAGHSMGGKALMHLLLKNPRIADKAAIIDIGPKNYPPGHDRFHQNLLEFTKNFRLTEFNSLTAIHQAIRTTIKQEEICQILFKNIRKKTGYFEWKINLTAIQNHLQELMAWDPPSQTTPYPYPLLFIRGEFSNYLSESDVPDIRSLFPLARLVTIPAANHCIYSGQPQILAQTLTDFFLE